jgi:phosphoglycolate phosphatase
MINADLLIFDIDGTLVDARKDIVKAVNYTLRELDIPLKSFDQIVSYIGTGVKDLLTRSLGRENNALLDKSLSVFGNYYRDHLADEAVLYPHVVEILEYFKEKTKAIISNRNKEFAELILVKLGIDKYFRNVEGADDNGCNKPDPCLLNNILRDIGTDKKRTIMIGDMDLDILAGKNAGVFTCGVTYGIGKKKDILKSGPDFIIDDLLKLKEIIKI